MKINDLRKVLRTDVVLYVEGQGYFKYEMWGLNDYDNTLADYRLVDVDKRTGDTMFLDYGDYIIDRVETVNGLLMITIHK